MTLVAIIGAALGFMVLIVLHELGHFTAAKAVGMRVERFALFFPPLLLRKTIGETEYALGAIPAGGYVKISGMSPDEDLPDEVRTRAYYSQPVWKRIVVIAAGPLVNFVLAFILLLVVYALIGIQAPSDRVETVERGFPAARVLEPGDRVLSVDGRAGTPEEQANAITKLRCAEKQRKDGCRATEPVDLVVRRDGKDRQLTLTPVYDAETKSMRLGFRRGLGPRETLAFLPAIALTADRFVLVTWETIKVPARLFDAEKRKEISGIVGAYEVTRRTILDDAADVVGILALVSLALAVINMFPFLPLDGGHIFWAIVEKIRRRPVSFSVMERAGVVGFMLVMVLFLVGFTNDLGRLMGEGFDVR